MEKELKMIDAPKVDLKTIVGIGEDGCNYYFRFEPSEGFLEGKGLFFVRPKYDVPFKTPEQEKIMEIVKKGRINNSYESN